MFFSDAKWVWCHLEPVGGTRYENPLQNQVRFRFRGPIEAKLILQINSQLTTLRGSAVPRAVTGWSLRNLQVVTQ
jgi:hypothetical protein